MKLQFTFLFFLLLLLGSNVTAQKVDLSLRFNPNNTTYEVYARPNFTKGGFLIGAGSQVTVLIPSDFQDVPLIANGSANIRWLDRAPKYAPSAAPKTDFHTFVAEGGTLNFQEATELLLFSFSLPLTYDHKAVRLFVNKIDPNLRNAGVLKNNLENYIANEISLTDFYQANYGLLKDVKGVVKDWRGYPIEGTKLSLNDQKATVLYDGRFEFNNVTVDDAANFSFERGIAADEGISTTDLIRLQQHLSGAKPFEEAYQWIAADLDNSGTITYADADLLKQIINATYDHAGWRFIPTSWLNNKQTYQRTIPSTLSIKKAERVFSMDFTGIKLGDVNGSYTLNPSIPNNILPSPKTLTINLLNVDLKAGQNYIVPFSTNDFDLLTAYQLTLKIENAQITQLENTFKKQPGLSLKQLPNDLVLANWLNDKVGRSVAVNQQQKASGHQSETAILELEIIPDRDGLLSDFITILDDPKPTEAYDKEGKVMPLQLLFRKAPEEEGSLEVYQNRPNPFRELTTINYFLPKNGTVTLTLTDESGKRLKVFTEKGKKGFNSFNIAGAEVPKGLIYYQLATEFGTVTKKMLHLN